jgi:hypothetical protein
MKLPKELDTCNHRESLWLKVFETLAADLRVGYDSCQCCIFWRGAIVMLLYCLLPTTLLLAEEYFAATTVWLFQTGVIVALTKETGK